MITTIILGFVQWAVFIAILVDALAIIWYLISIAVGIDFLGKSKKMVLITIAIMIGIFYLDGVIFDVFKVHIVSFPILWL